MNENETSLRLGDFVCPRYYAEVPATTANERASVYQVVEIQQNKIIIARNPFNPVEEISASEDFFIKLK